MSEYLDASVVVKWFKKGEPYESEAMAIYGMIRELETDAVTSEWTALEVVRGLTKVGYPKEKIEASYEIIMELSGTGQFD
jgi:predicted nucleic acid-binding protein